MYDLHNKKFKGLDNTDNGEVSEDTIFHYRQKDNIVWATYEGGDIIFGTLSGRLDRDTIAFNYQHRNIFEEFMTGRCITTITKKGGKLFLNENWQWTCGDHTNGKSILQEIDDEEEESI